MLKIVHAHGDELLGHVDGPCNVYCHDNIHSEVIWVPPTTDVAKIKREWPYRMPPSRIFMSAVEAPEAKPVPFEDAVLQYRGDAKPMDEAHRSQTATYRAWRVTWRRTDA